MRARQLGIQHCLVGVKDKLKGLDGLQKDLNIATADTVFIGDDRTIWPYGHWWGCWWRQLMPAPPCAIAPTWCSVDAAATGRAELAELILQARGEWSELRRLGWRDRND
ncbi:MAG: hypothetical protein CM15mP116_00260 [Synechococcus sp.]|nr:MAG: hypothetical protein CM15mP116_00260 [Synechococcus sp.]